MYPSIFNNILTKINILALTIVAISSCSSISIEEQEAPLLDEIHNRILTIDSHVDISADYTLKPEYDPGKRTKMQVDLIKMNQGGLDSGFFIVYVEQTKRTQENYVKAQKSALRKFRAIHRMTDELYPNQIELAYSPSDVRAINAKGLKIAIIGIENGYVIGKNLSLLEDYYRMGARYMTLSHNGHNDICDSAQPKIELGDNEAEHNGLSKFGAKVIIEMNRLGMMIDISHTSVKCMTQTIKLSKAPVIASHSSVYSLTAHPRNMTDEQMKLLANNGGVMQIVAYSEYLKEGKMRRKAIDELLETVRNRYGLASNDYQNTEKTTDWKNGILEINTRFPLATISDFIDHIDYAVNLIGIDHVGISSDFDGGGGISGWKDASESMNVTAELLARGYTENQIAKIWGGNLLRVWNSIDKVASKINNNQ